MTIKPYQATFEYSVPELLTCKGQGRKICQRDCKYYFKRKWGKIRKEVFTKIMKKV